MYQAIIFDVDGTLLNTEIGNMRAWKEAGLARGIHIPEPALKQTRAVSAKVATEIFQRYCGEDFPYSELLVDRKRRSEEIFASMSAQELRFPHVLQTLQVLKEKGYPMAVASSTAYPQTVEHLQHTEILEFFQVVVGGDMIKKGKPEPDIFLLAAEKLGVAPEHCLVVGDTPADVLAATAAGMDVILIPDQVPANDRTRPLSRFVLEHIGQLPGVLEA